MSADYEKHVSVLLSETIDGLMVKPEGIYVDGTVGLGGHAIEIASKLSTGKLICIDLDEEAITISKNRLISFADKVVFVQDDYKNLFKHMDLLNIKKLDGLVLDLGVSSMQIDDPSRGFSYIKDGILDMRMDRSRGISAYDVINEYAFKDLARIFREYGEERLAGKIAAKIDLIRKQKKIENTIELACIVQSCYPKSYKDGNPAKRVFQALRIEVNQELKDLYEFILSATLRLNEGGRIAVISFHSLEDRIVKQAFCFLEKDCICDKRLPVCVCQKRKEVKIITGKPISPSSSELRDNSRAKSAKLRIAERV